MRENAGALKQITVPTAAQRQGDFSNTRTGLGSCNHRDPQTNAPFPGNMISEPVQPVWPGHSQFPATAERIWKSLV